MKDGRNGKKTVARKIQRGKSSGGSKMFTTNPFTNLPFPTWEMRLESKKTLRMSRGGEESLACCPTMKAPPPAEETVSAYGPLAGMGRARQEYKILRQRLLRTGVTSA